MAAFYKQAYSAFVAEKPHSSITEWVEILTSSTYDAETYDGIPEIVESIDLQATGPGEASRAIRKKIKHGNPHQQYRALHILKALVENGGPKVQTSFNDSMLIEAIRHLASDPSTDPKVKKKLILVLAGWRRQFQDDPSMAYVAKLYDQCKLTQGERVVADRRAIESVNLGVGLDVEYLERKKREDEARKKKEEEKRKAREDKERRKREDEERRRKASQPKSKRKPFNFEQEKPQILNTIASASQTASNLVNAMTLVNTQHDSLETNERVQECLKNVKQFRRQIVRYIQLVENEDMIGVLIETNDRIIAAIENYDLLTKPDTSEQQIKDIQESLATTKLSTGELGKLQEKQRAAINRSISRPGPLNTSPGSGETSPTSPSSPSYVHPDLQDLQFGPLGVDQSGLPPPIRPTARHRSSSEDEDPWRRGSLSDYSDYQSSDEDTHNHPGPSSSAVQPRRRGYVDVSDSESDARRNPKQAASHEEEDPFADPFAD